VGVTTTQLQGTGLEGPFVPLRINGGPKDQKLGQEKGGVHSGSEGTSGPFFEGNGGHIFNRVRVQKVLKG